MKKKEIVAPDTRSEICFGFEDEVFSEFSKNELKLLRDLSKPLITEKMVNQHKDYFDDKEARQYALSELLRLIILEANTNPNVIYKKSYVVAVLKKMGEKMNNRQQAI